jgi:hypothetical protein
MWAAAWAVERAAAAVTAAAAAAATAATAAVRETAEEVVVAAKEAAARAAAEAVGVGEGATGSLAEGRAKAEEVELQPRHAQVQPRMSPKRLEEQTAEGPDTTRGKGRSTYHRTTAAVAGTAVAAREAAAGWAAGRAAAAEATEAATAVGHWAAAMALRIAPHTPHRWSGSASLFGPMPQSSVAKRPLGQDHTYVGAVATAEATAAGVVTAAAARQTARANRSPRARRRTATRDRCLGIPRVAARWLPICTCPTLPPSGTCHYMPQLASGQRQGEIHAVGVMPSTPSRARVIIHMYGMHAPGDEAAADAVEGCEAARDGGHGVARQRTIPQMHLRDHPFDAAPPWAYAAASAKASESFAAAPLVGVNSWELATRTRNGPTSSLRASAGQAARCEGE